MLSIRNTLKCKIVFVCGCRFLFSLSAVLNWWRHFCDALMRAGERCIHSYFLWIESRAKRYIREIKWTFNNAKLETFSIYLMLLRISPFVALRYTDSRFIRRRKSNCLSLWKCRYFYWLSQCEQNCEIYRYIFGCHVPNASHQSGMPIIIRNRVVTKSNRKHFRNK